LLFSIIFLYLCCLALFFYIYVYYKKMSSLKGDFAKPDATLRFQSLYLDGDIDCNAIHARSIIPDPTNDLVCNKLKSNSIENTGTITTTNLIGSGDVKGTNVVGIVNTSNNPIAVMPNNPNAPIVLNTNIRQQVLRFTGIGLTGHSIAEFVFSWGTELNISNWIFTAYVVNNNSNQNNIPLVASIANTSPTIFTNVKRVMITNVSPNEMVNGEIDVLITLLKNPGEE
jgi:hypothetical protein